MNKTKPKALLLICVSMMLILTGCLPNEGSQNGEAPFQWTPITPLQTVFENYYRSNTNQPFKPSQSRGMLSQASTLQEYRLDAERLELGLLELAQNYFHPEEYFFQEGQVINSTLLTNWLRIRGEGATQGLNTDAYEARILRHILEHNYVNIETNELEGIVLGLSVTSSYRVTQPNGVAITHYFNEDEVRNLGARFAEQITERLRQRNQQVPIIFAIYQLEDQRSIVPGNFVTVGYVEAGQNYVSQWRSVNETYLLFPSTALTQFDRVLSRAFNDFRREVQEFFPNFVGIIGKGRFIDEQLVEITLNVNTQFASKTEVIQLTQFMGNKAIAMLDDHVHINLYVDSVNRSEAIFVRAVGQAPMMHVYR
jgi:protein involved in sex pheromone biosynthesis